MRSIGEFVRRKPRFTSSLAFGISTATLTHFAWFADIRMSGLIPVLTFGAGLAHAVAGALTGPRLINTVRTRTYLQAGLLGAATSLLALAFFAPVMAWYISSENVQTSVLGYAAMTLFTGLFAFLAAGWALLVLSVVVGWCMHRLAIAAS